MRRRFAGEWAAAAAGAGLACIGWSVHATLLALAGSLVAFVAVALWAWQRHCLTGVSYRRSLRAERATFGQEVAMDVELVNDKLLPLTWLHVEDAMPPGLTIRGGTVTAGPSETRRHLLHLVPMLPFQRVRRHLTVVCDQRGDHTFGPARLRSGDPVGLHEVRATDRANRRLLVYPKLFRLTSEGVASRLPLGDRRSDMVLIGDPSRVAGVRDYREGDPIRHIDWRATARATSLLVRVFEPTAAPKVAVFIDMQAPKGSGTSGRDIVEFTIAVGASVVADLVGRGIATGVYASGSVGGRTVAREPSSSPAGLPAMLELLARATPWGPVPFADVLAGEGGRLRPGASVVVVSPDFAAPLAAALVGLGRRLPVTAVWVDAAEGRPPPAGTVDLAREVTYADGWKQRDVLELAL